MRKTKLLMVAFMAMLGLSVNAQSVTPSTVEEGYFRLYNVGKSQYFTQGNAWGTQASMTTGTDEEGISAAIVVELIKVDGYYFIRTGVGNANYGLECLNANDMYTDQSRGKQSTWDFVNVGTEEAPVYNLITVAGHGGGAGYYLTANEENTVLAPGTDGESDYARWILVYDEERNFEVAASEFNKIYAQAEALGTQTVAETALQAAYNATLPQAQTNFQAATTAKQVKAVIAQVQTGMLEYINHVAAIDLTCLLPNADVTPLWDGTWGIQPEGWYNEQSGGNFQVMSNGNMGPGGEVFMEYWNGSPAQSGFVLCQKVILPEGTYQMTGRVAANFDGQGGTVQNVFFAANEVLGTQITSETLMDASLEFVQASTSEVKIGMKATEGNQARWMGINKITLAKVPASSFVLDEDVEFIPVDKAGNVTLNKTLYQGWNSIVLPCFVDNATVGLMKMNFNAELYKFTGAEEGKLMFEAANTIDPHTPYLLKIGSTEVNGSKETIPLGDLTLSTGNPAATPFVGYNFVGTYTPLAAGNDVITSDDYVLGETDFVKAQGGNALKAFRAYIKTNTEELKPNEEGARELKIVVDGEVTTIKSIDGKNLSNDAIFNLSGQRVVKAQKGLYIQNGKKVVIK